MEWVAGTGGPEEQGRRALRQTQMIRLAGTDEQASLDPKRRGEARRDIAVFRELETFLGQARRDIKQVGNTFSFTVRPLLCSLVTVEIQRCDSTALRYSRAKHKHAHIYAKAHACIAVSLRFTGLRGGAN